MNATNLRARLIVWISHILLERRTWRYVLDVSVKTLRIVFCFRSRVNFEHYLMSFAELIMNVNSEVTWIRAASNGFRRPRNASMTTRLFMLTVP